MMILVEFKLICMNEVSIVATVAMVSLALPFSPPSPVRIILNYWLWCLTTRGEAKVGLVGVGCG